MEILQKENTLPLSCSSLFPTFGGGAAYARMLFMPPPSRFLASIFSERHLCSQISGWSLQSTTLCHTLMSLIWGTLIHLCWLPCTSAGLPSGWHTHRKHRCLLRSSTYLSSDTSRRTHCSVLLIMLLQ
ncbi:hypothetical protein DAEQUDRAFT_162928 [Daedalea quercina L-15889]|uniref:Uncharacterized protein n=1 Tax=Daedalea quercina L-15889 TaxID=1314783 RepID=A0A165RGF9_9APHY|nr:hypothetical protein DAEQUDRAFT_162928 [Daedalea quercina L-15889]